ncbi:MAG: amidohydrolase family protein, partial [Alphaproteobacteria bacterium]|nr:amidohydrolase family protein [Alphaproteobacteria bacterium]
MIVDCHVNLWRPEHFTPLYAEQMKRVRPDGGYGLIADADTIHAEMAGVDRAILFSPRYGDSAGVDGDDGAVAEAVARYPDKFVGFAYVDPREPDCLERLVHGIEVLGLCGVKYGPIYNGVALSDPRLTPIYEYCQQNDLPLTLHMGTTFAQHAPLELGRAGHVDPVAERFPDLKIVCAHMGHPWYQECIAVVRKRPNVYCEIAAIFYRPWQLWNILIAAEEYAVTDKIFFGTDFPFSGVDESLAGLRGVNRVLGGSGLPEVSNETIERIIHS